MGTETTIAWCHKTFNPIIGCARVTSACTSCYAEQYANRYSIAKWGIHGTRHITSDANWKKPMQWQKQAEKEGVRYRVFCASLSDVFEDHPTWLEVRERLWKLIEATPNLDWMLLTKRPENFERFFPERWLTPTVISNIADEMIGIYVNDINNFPQNIWLGATIANQKDYDEFMPYLNGFCVKHDVSVMFTSCEPLLGQINFRAEDISTVNNFLCLLGGESGFITKIRQLNLYQVKHIFDQLSNYPNTRIFFKQLGSILAKEYNLKDKKGEKFEEYPELLSWLKVRQMPHYEHEFETVT